MKRFALLLLTLFMGITTATARIQLDLETGAAFSVYNDARIPNSSEFSKFSFTEDLSSDAVMFFRTTLHYPINDRHRLSLLYAPLSIKPNGKFESDVLFQGETFPAGTDINALYRFDSYRLMYRYFFRNQNRLCRAIGLTVKLRDAEIKLTTADRSATKKNKGFVPIINFLLAHNVASNVDLILDGDALFSPFGRAADVLMAVNVRIVDRFTKSSAK